MLIDEFKHSCGLVIEPHNFATILNVLNEVLWGIGLRMYAEVSTHDVIVATTDRTRFHRKLCTPFSQSLQIHIVPASTTLVLGQMQMSSPPRICSLHAQEARSHLVVGRGTCGLFLLNHPITDRTTNHRRLLAPIRYPLLAQASLPRSLPMPALSLVANYGFGAFTLRLPREASPFRVVGLNLTTVLGRHIFPFR